MHLRCCQVLVAVVPRPLALPVWRGQPAKVRDLCVLPRAPAVEAGFAAPCAAKAEIWESYVLDWANLLLRWSTSLPPPPGLVRRSTSSLDSSPTPPEDEDQKAGRER